MAETVRIASTLPMALRITEPDPNPEKPGLTGALKTTVLNGTNTPGAGAEGITEGVDAGLFKAWSDLNPETAAHLRVLGNNEEVEAMGQYGFEPGLAALVDDKDNAKAAREGSTLTGAGPVAAADMKTGSNNPAAAPVAAPASPKPGK